MTAKAKSVLQKVGALALLVAFFLVAFKATSVAAGAAEPADGSLLDLLRPVYDAFAHDDYWYAGSLALAVACALARKYGGDHVPWFRSAAGTATLLLLGSFGASLSTKLVGGVDLTGAMAWDATKIAFYAAGGYAILKALVVDPLLVPLAERYPKLAPVVGLLTFFFQTSGSKPAA